MIISRADCVPWGVSELQLDMVMRVSLFMQDGRRKSTEAVPRHLSFVPHALQALQDRVVAHGLGAVAVAWKEPIASAGERSQHFQTFDGLPGKRYDVGSSHLHSFGGNIPTGRFQVEFAPFGFDQFAGADERERQQLDGKPGDVGAVVHLNLFQQVGKFFRVDPGVVGFADGFQNVAGPDFDGGIPLGVSVSDA